MFLLVAFSVFLALHPISAGAGSWQETRAWTAGWWDTRSPSQSRQPSGRMSATEEESVAFRISNADPGSRRNDA